MCTMSFQKFSEWSTSCRQANQIDIFYTDDQPDDRIQARVRKVQTKRNWAALRKKLVADDPKSEGGNNPETSTDHPA